MSTLPDAPLKDTLLMIENLRFSALYSVPVLIKLWSPYARV
jgi:hypothetical protein